MLERSLSTRLEKYKKEIGATPNDKQKELIDRISRNIRLSCKEHYNDIIKDLNVLHHTVHQACQTTPQRYIDSPVENRNNPSWFFRFDTTGLRGYERKEIENNELAESEEKSSLRT